MGWMSGMWWACLVPCAVMLSAPDSPGDQPVDPSVADCYTPIPGGWQIRLSEDANATRLEPGSRIGVVDRGGRYGEGHAIVSSTPNNPRLDRRPLYPPADKSLIWTEAEREKMPQCGFRPLVLAYNEPRFLFDFHSAGGLLGHLFVGLTAADGASKWLHQCAELEVRYVDGHMEYVVRDPAFPGVTVNIEAIALAHSVGLLLKVELTGLRGGEQLTWMYGGGSAFFTNYAMTAPEFAFAPAQCAKDRVRWTSDGFTLTRAFDKSDVIMEQVFAAPKFLPDWQAKVCGGSSWQGRRGFGDPNAVIASPAELCRSAKWVDADSADNTNCVVVQRVALDAGHNEGYVAVGMGGDIEQAVKHPSEALKTARDRNAEIAARIVAHTPDPYLDAAVTMMAFATDGTWGDSTVMHGGWSWRFGYLGWRGWYGSTCYGWTDRIRTAIRNFIRYGLIKTGDDEGALSSLLDTPGGVFYNMNEVFLDHVRQYFDYTNDVELMREIFPVLAGIVDWESRRLQPGNEGLYENALNTWISDSHWYIQGQCTQASAYMLGAHRFLVNLAQRLGLDAKPFQTRADTIFNAMQNNLWMKDAGVYAEYLDTRGAKLLHTEPELPTIYHAIEFGAVRDYLQTCEMVQWAHTHLRSAQTPGGGRFFWSSNWFPNNGRSYTHSTYEMAYAEELNFALSNWAAGRTDDAYAILRATLCGIFNGPTPGGLACHARTDGRQRANDEFADAISMWGRTVCEGLFGILPQRADDRVVLRPGFPWDWQDATISTRQFSYRWKRDPACVTIEWSSPIACSVRAQIPVRAASIKSATSDGSPVAHNLEPGLDLTWVTFDTSKSVKGTIRVEYEPQSLPTSAAVTVKQGDEFRLSLPGMPITKCHFGDSLLEQPKISDGGVTARASGTPANRVCFAEVQSGTAPAWIPIPLDIEAATPPDPPKPWTPPQAGDHDPDRWAVVDLNAVFNSTIIDALEKVEKEATPPPAGASRVGFDYWRSHLSPLHHGERVQMPSDAAWRAKVGPDGVAWTTDGIPFKTVKDGANIGIVTQAGGFPASLEFPVHAAGQTLYLMLSGMTFPVQSHMVHLRVTLGYKDGTSSTIELTSPDTIGDCWSTWCGRWHDTAANGFENLGCRTGPKGSAETADLTQPVAVDTEAHLVAVPLKADGILDTVRIEAVANDILFGIMGATVLR